MDRGPDRFCNNLNALGPGWRRSADRTCLQPNSMQTGNFSGNFVKSPPERALSTAGNACTAVVSVTTSYRAVTGKSTLENREIDTNKQRKWMKELALSESGIVVE